MVIATHDGSFHADEVFAVAALSLLGEPTQVVRTRDPEMLKAADLRVDVGFRDDAQTGDFDHHQRGFEAGRPNGVRYASFGLVWREFGVRICGGDAEVAAAVDETLVQTVDANDTGQRLTETIVDGVRPFSISAVIGGFNASWDETLTAEQTRARFDAAVSLAHDILAREIAAAASGRRAERIVRAAIAAAADPRVVELTVNAPWKRVLVPEAPDALFVIYPKRQGFGLEAVPAASDRSRTGVTFPRPGAAWRERTSSPSPVSRMRCSATPSGSSSSRRRTKGSPGLAELALA